ncbi:MULTISPECIES: ADP-ribosylglycohydrolase family protein [unclassified Kitasatospora]|uniref:ADP-ribosylglycohydrolase family protein n=2 Tax=unclassified Kitasatospora TaxID=2633591 RepID=UPI000AF9A6AE
MHQVLRQIDAGADWRTVTSEMFGGQGSYGNGAAMRVAPLGAWFADDLDRVVEQARLSALVTHFNPEAVAGAVAVAVAAALAVRSRGGSAPERADFLAEVAGWLPESDVRSRTADRGSVPGHGLSARSRPIGGAHRSNYRVSRGSCRTRFGNRPAGRRRPRRRRSR